MARGDKNYDKVVRKVNKGGKSKARIKAVHSMVENIIQGDMDAAADDLKTATQLISREILLGEAADEENMDAEESSDESGEEETDDDESDDESESESDGANDDESESDDDESDDEDDK